MTKLQTDLTHFTPTVIQELKRSSKQFADYLVHPVHLDDPAALSAWFEQKGTLQYAIDAITLFALLFTLAPIAEWIQFARLVYAFLSVHRVILHNPGPEFDTITGPFKGKDVALLQKEIAPALEALGISSGEFVKRAKRSGGTVKYHLSTKGGPNGKAMYSAWADALALQADETTLKALFEVSEFFKISALGEDLLRTACIPGYSSRHESDLVTGRILEVQEWGGKCRLVATLDYWSQVALGPLHDTVNHFLRPLDMDGTFNQERVAEDVRNWTTDQASELYSFDLTAATDRLPIAFQKDILAILLGSSEAALAWQRLLTSRAFMCSDNVARKYAVGQPMGAKSSFPMLALSHHTIVQMAARRAGVTGVFADYRIVGDDVVIRGSRVAAHYQDIMTDLGVKISEGKSFIHVAGTGPVAEICRRIFINGHELTSYPVKLIAKTANASQNVVPLQSILVDRAAFDSKTAMTCMTGLVDRESTTKLITMNALPSSVTGIRHPCGAVTENLNYANMYDGITISDKDLEHAYTYAAVVDQIKRLDALLKESQLIAGLIQSQARGFEVTELKGVDSKLLRSYKERLAQKFPVLRPFHPINRAVEQEIDRIGVLLSALRAGDASISAMAKSQLIDQFRSPITEILDPASEMDNRPPTFTLVNKALTHLDSQVLDHNCEGLNFSILLVSLQRHYNVSWVFKEGVFVNTVKAKVEQAISRLESGLSVSSGRISLSPRRHRVLQDSIRTETRAR
jgi:hypothetical protein